MSQEKPTENQKSGNGRPVIHYILVMFIAAFLLMAFSMLMQQRTTAEGLGQLQHSFSAMQSLQSYQETVIELQNALNDADTQRETLESTIEALEAALDSQKDSLTALSYLYTLQQQYLAEDYDNCRSTIQTMETLGLDLLLSAQREYGVPSPAETFQSIKTTLAVAESAQSEALPAA